MARKIGQNKIFVWSSVLHKFTSQKIHMHDFINIFSIFNVLSLENFLMTMNFIIHYYLDLIMILLYICQKAFIWYNWNINICRVNNKTQKQTFTNSHTKNTHKAHSDKHTPTKAQNYKNGQDELIVNEFCFIKKTIGGFKLSVFVSSHSLSLYLSLFLYLFLFLSLSL